MALREAAEEARETGLSLQTDLQSERTLPEVIW